jgi:DNA-binding transcriptional regulator YhcF (GntR family)
MIDSAKKILKRQDLFQDSSPSKWENPFPDFTLEETVPLKLVGFARSLVRVSFFRKSYSLSLSDEYLRKLWAEEGKDISRSTVQRRLNELQKCGVIFIRTGAASKLPDGNFTKDRTLHLIPIIKPARDSHYVSKLTHQKNYSLLESNRTIQEKEKKEGSFIDVYSLKQIPPKKRQKPDKSTRPLQIIFIKKALARIIEEEELNYRFMCLMLRQCFGSNEQTVRYYGSVLHMQLRFKPELVASTLELMLKSYDGIHKPVGFLIAELQAALGKEPKKKLVMKVPHKKPVVEESLESGMLFPKNPEVEVAEKQPLVFLELEEQREQNLLNKSRSRKIESCKKKVKPKKQNPNPREGFAKVLKMLKH